MGWFRWTLWFKSWDLKSGLVQFQMPKRGWFANGSNFKYDLKYKQMTPNLPKTIWNPNKNVWILNGPVFEWLEHSYSQSYSPTLWKPDHLKSDLPKVWILKGRILDAHWIFKFRLKQKKPLAVIVVTSDSPK